MGYGLHEINVRNLQDLNSNPKLESKFRDWILMQDAALGVSLYIPRNLYVYIHKKKTQ